MPPADEPLTLSFLLFQFCCFGPFALAMMAAVAFGIWKSRAHHRLRMQAWNERLPDAVLVLENLSARNSASNFIHPKANYGRCILMVTEGSLLIRVGNGLWQIQLTPDAPLVSVASELIDAPGEFRLMTLQSWTRTPDEIDLLVTTRGQDFRAGISGTSEALKQLLQHLPAQV